VLEVLLELPKLGQGREGILDSVVDLQLRDVGHAVGEPA
jgi:hypothetical protein